MCSPFSSKPQIHVGCTPGSGENTGSARCSYKPQAPGRVLRPVQLVLLTKRAGRPGRQVTVPLWASRSVKADLSMPESEGSELKEQREPVSCHRAGPWARERPFSHQSEARRLPVVGVQPRQSHQVALPPKALGTDLHLAFSLICIYVLLGAEVATADKANSAPAFTGLTVLIIP